MLNESEFAKYCDRHNLPLTALDYCQEGRHTEPARLVGSPAGVHVITTFASQKMGRTIQAESSTGELAFLMQSELGDEVIEIWDQCPPVSVVRINKNGKEQKGSYIADYLVLTKSGAEIVECKPMKSIVDEQGNLKTNWGYKDDQIVYLPAYNAFKKIGLHYRVVINEDLSKIFTANVRIMLQTRHSEVFVSEEIKLAVHRELDRHAWLTMSELAKKLGIDDMSPLIKLIIEKKLFAQLDKQLLSQPESIILAGSKDALIYANQLMEKNYNIFPSEKDGYVTSQNVPAEKYIKHVLEKLRRIDSGEKSNSVRRWKREIKKGEKKDIGRVEALLPKYYRCGNKRPRINSKVEKFLLKFINNEYAGSRRMSVSAAHRKYLAVADNRHPEFHPVSIKKFKKTINELDQVELARKRGGKRAANAASEPTDVHDRELRATLPWECAAIDHHNADIHGILVSGDGVEYTARPWISVLRDVCNGKVLSFWISFRNPSSVTDAMLIRRCVRDHGRLPFRIISDKGRDFYSKFFHMLLAFAGVSLSLHPTAHARYGAEVERFFGLLNTHWINLKPGNIVQKVESRSVSESHSAEKHAILRIEDLYSELEYVVNWNNSTIHGYKDQTPNYSERQALRKYSCLGVKVKYDNKFIINSSVGVKAYKLDPVRGLHVHEFHYWSPKLKSLSSKNRPVEVRIDPEDPFCIYALVDNEWVTCLSNGSQQFATKNLISRMTEAISIHDGRKLRKLARKESEIEFNKKLIESEESYKKTKSMIEEKEDEYTVYQFDDVVACGVEVLL